MKLAVMQPYFFPYLGYFALIKHTDYWVVFDTVQFIKHGWIARNRILKPNHGWQYIQVPLEKHSIKTAIKDIRIKQESNWDKKILAQLDHYKKKAIYYNDVISLIKQVFSCNSESIVDLNIIALSAICDYLKMDFSYTVFSKSNINVSEINAPDEWALQIAKALGANTYYNPPGGVDFFDTGKYQKNGIDIRFLKINLLEYKQKGNPFEPGLSIIDVMMFNSPAEISKMLDNYTLI